MQKRAGDSAADENVLRGGASLARAVNNNENVARPIVFWRLRVKSRQCIFIALMC